MSVIQNLNVVKCRLMTKNDLNDFWQTEMIKILNIITENFCRIFDEIFSLIYGWCFCFFQKMTDEVILW